MSESEKEPIEDDDCGSCGADIGPNTEFVWHYADEECRAIRQPLQS